MKGQPPAHTVAKHSELQLYALPFRKATLNKSTPLMQAMHNLAKRSQNSSSVAMPSQLATAKSREKSVNYDIQRHSLKPNANNNVHAVAMPTDW